MVMTSGADNDDQFEHAPGGQAGGEADLRPRELTWAALLAQWLDFARASVALPADAEGDRWRASVAPIINLQAVTFALADLDSLNPDERSLGLDRAEWLICGTVEKLNRLWRGQPCNPLIEEIIRDARRALQIAGAGRIIEFVLPTILGDGGESNIFAMPDLCELIIEIAERAEFHGELYIAEPGTLLAGGEPVATIAAEAGAVPPLIASSFESNREPDDQPGSATKDVWRRFALALAPAAPRIVPAARQVYRVIDTASGRIQEDRITLLNGEPQPGRPLLMPALENGRRVAEFPSSRESGGAAAAAAERWADQQRNAWPNGGLAFRVTD